MRLKSFNQVFLWELMHNHFRRKQVVYHWHICQQSEARVLINNMLLCMSATNSWILQLYKWVGVQRSEDS